MATNSRHMACKTCRDRKVRCDGGQPACQKCERAGHTCIYVPATKFSKADLLEAFHNLSERLEATEAQLAAAKNNPQQDQTSSGATDERTLVWAGSEGSAQTPSSRDEMLNFGFPIQRGSEVWTQGMLGEDGLGVSSMPVNSANMLYSPIYAGHIGFQGTEGTLEESTTASAYPFSFSTPSTRISQGSPLTPFALQPGSVGHLPSLQEIRQWSNIGNSADPTNNRSSRGPQCPESNVVEGEAHGAMAVFQIHAAFAMAMLCMQLDITGIAGAMTDYVAWTRLNSRAVNSGTTEGTELINVFNMLEARIRELSGIASQQMQDALRASRAEFVGDAKGVPVDTARSTRRVSIDAEVSSRFRTLDKEMSSKTSQVEVFFRSGYDIHDTLAQQRQQGNPTT